VIAGLRPVQVAYHVPDPADAAERCAREFGWGPFVLLEHIALQHSLHRGTARPFDHTSAYGQAGEVMVELITQHDDTPSALRDLYAAHESGIHHVACFVDDLAAELQRFRARGVAIALEARTQTGVDFAMVDLSEQLGHMLELYEAGDDLRRFYAHVRKLADGWTGERPVRRPRT
jgi:catechol 2,3-dioxygenase-like lactoylglutathione lyase family enzyme